MAGYARHCDVCGKTYNRSNRVRLWISTNFGHRAGWLKKEQKICCRCLGEAEARETLHDINPQFVNKPGRKNGGVKKPA